jgi:hypothetical protein
MNYLTWEVEIDHGKLVSKAKLPEKASGLLTIFQTDTTAATIPPLQALDALQKHLGLDAQTASHWMSAVRAARR